MKLKDGFVTHMFDDTQVLIGTESVSFKGIVAELTEMRKTLL